MTIELQGDCLQIMPMLEGCSIDAVICDPPYELGFMGKKWDASGIAYNVEVWRQCLRILKPGGYLLAFGGTRTYHRMACAIEDAGFEIRDMIEWCYGSGFPKSLNIGKAVDKLQGNERENLDERGGAIQKGSVAWSGNDRTEGKGSGFKERFIETKGTSEWEGWGTNLKPSHEPICMARKPLAEKTVAENCLKYGTGGINIDESRVDLNGEKQPMGSGNRDGVGNTYQLKDWISHNGGNTTPTQGRFPANLIHDNSEEVRACFPESKGCSGGGIRKNKSEIMPSIQIKGDMDNSHLHRNDSGNASRFFKSIKYCPKASKSERNKGCEGLEEKQSVGGGGGIGNYLDDVNSASGKFGSEKAPAKNIHPCVKPIALMEYLINVVTREGGTVLDPFMGSGTTGVACKNLKRNFVGIELDQHYFEIAKNRIENTCEPLLVL